MDTTNKPANFEAIVKRLYKLHKMLTQNRNAYYNAIDNDKSLSNRMYNWIDEYNEARGSCAWIAFCQNCGFDEHHDAYDNFA